MGLETSIEDRLDGKIDDADWDKITRLSVVLRKDITLPRLPCNLDFLGFFSNTSVQIPPVLPHRLKKLDIRHCMNLTTIPELPDSIEIFTLMNTKVDRIPNLPEKLVSLSLEGNKMLSFLPEFPSGLLYLSIVGSPIHVLPRFPDGLTQFLTLKSLKITSLQTISHLKLTTLTCSNCPIQEFPPIPDTVRNLDLSGCSVQELPPIPDTVRNLDLSGCPIQELPLLPDELISLDIGWCKNLTRLAPFPSKLQIFCCDHTRLEKIPPLPEELRRFSCNMSWLTEVNLPPRIVSYYCMNCPRLTKVTGEYDWGNTMFHNYHEIHGDSRFGETPWYKPNKYRLEKLKKLQRWFRKKVEKNRFFRRIIFRRILSRKIPTYLAEKIVTYLN